MSITITATASGDTRPETTFYPDKVYNGDFTIVGREMATHVGDGREERTSWTFDFTPDLQYRLLSEWLPLTSALLTLTLTPRHFAIADTVRIARRRAVVTPLIQGLQVGPTCTIVLQLLDWYSSDEILSCLFDRAGHLQMTYSDNAVISFAQLELTQRQVPMLQYAAKVACGEESGKILSEGVYHTAVNVHNPSDKPVRFRTKIAVALPGKPGPVSGFKEHELPADGAVEFDGHQIREWAEVNAELLKGFFVIESTAPLDIVAVYTAGSREDEAASIHTERVPVRKRRPKLPDLVPVPDPDPGIGFCKLVPDGYHAGKLIVTIRNQGDAVADESTTRVTFRSGSSFDLPTPPIPAGASVDLEPLTIPGDCYEPDCFFTIIADAEHEVDESDEANNTATGCCPE